MNARRYIERWARGVEVAVTIVKRENHMLVFRRADAAAYEF